MQEFKTLTDYSGNLFSFGIYIKIFSCKIKSYKVMEYLLLYDKELLILFYGFCVREKWLQ